MENVSLYCNQCLSDFKSVALTKNNHLNIGIVLETVQVSSFKLCVMSAPVQLEPFIWFCWQVFKWALSNFVWCQLLVSLNLSYSFVDRCVCFLHRTTMPCISSLSLSTCVSVVTKVPMSVGLCCLLPEITLAFVAECSGDCPLMPWLLIKMEKMCHCV